jgi:hypothetical protein
MQGPIGDDLCLQRILQLYGISNCNFLHFCFATFSIFILQQIDTLAQKQAAA